MGHHQVKQNNLEAAANAIIEGEDVSKLEQATTWDDSVFNADRDGNDTNLRPLGTSPTPTRGPSPARSLGLQNPKTKMDEDRELEAALAASRGGKGAPYQQEMGVLRSDGTEQKFGPATREYYENEQWALVPSLAVASEIVPDVDVQHRVHVSGEPRLLKHMLEGDYLPNLLTICNAIPAAREAFLMREHVRADYGQDPDWWRGHTIPMPRIVHTIDGTPSDPDSDNYDELIVEAQRLMAFLDFSNRSYANVGGLTQTNIIQSTNPMTTRSGTSLELFLKKWTAAATAKAETASELSEFFTTTVGTNSPEGLDTPDLTLVDLKVTGVEGEKTDLLELMDNLLWDTEPNEVDPAENYIERPAEVVVMRVTHIKGSATQLGVEAPASFYLDKYLRQNVAMTTRVRQQMSQGRKRVAQIERIERKLKEWQHPQKSTQLEARQLLQHSLDHFSGKNRRDVDKADRTNDGSAQDQEPPHYADIATKLEQVIASIDNKLEILAQEKEKTRKAISEMSRSAPPELTDSDMQHHYTLRGVATKANITYVLQSKGVTEDEEMLLQPEDDGTPKGMQWWRIDYEVMGSTAHITKTRAPDYDVLRAVELEHNSALLVYASDRASSMDHYNPELPDPLKEFCERDSRLFVQELQAEEVRPPAYDFADQPRQSIERTSMDSTRVEGGNSPLEGQSPPGYGDVGFDDHPGFGLGYDIKPGTRMDKDDPPVAEIKLSPEADLMDVSSGKEVEMVEKVHEPLLPGLQRAETTDTTMDGGAESQNAGIGGAMHVEKSEME